MAPWFALVEAWAVAAPLLRNQTFNRSIQKAYRKINKLPDPEAGVKGVQRTGPTTFDHFKDEVRTQFRELTWRGGRK